MIKSNNNNNADSFFHLNFDVYIDVDNRGRAKMECLILFSAPHFLFRSAATVFLRLSNETMFSGSTAGSVTVSGTTTCVTIGTTAICFVQWSPSAPTRSICFLTAMDQIASAMTLFTTGTCQPSVGHCAQWPSCKTTLLI